MVRATTVTLEFTTQKNSVKGEKISMGRSPNPSVCPVCAAWRRIAHLRTNGAPDDTPIYTYYANHSAKSITTAMMTRALRTAAAAVHGLTGIDPKKVEARSLRSGGATAMLCARIDPLLVKLVGRWRSDAMLLYLRTMAPETTRDVANAIYDKGYFHFPVSFDLSTESESMDDLSLLPLETPQPIIDLLTADDADVTVAVATATAAEEAAHGIPA